MIRVAMVRSRVLQDVRNFLAHRILGFVDAQHAFADRLSEVTIGYPGSPLNSGSLHGLRRARPRAANPGFKAIRRRRPAALCADGNRP